MGEVIQEEEDLTVAEKQSEEKSSSSIDSAISISSPSATDADSSTTSSIDGDAVKICSRSFGTDHVDSHQDVSQQQHHQRPPPCRQPKVNSTYHYHHYRPSYMRYEQQQQQVSGAPFGAQYAPPPSAPLAALHRPPANATQTLLYEPPETISMGHHLAPLPPTTYCEAIGPTQPATAVYTAAAAAQATATAMPMALPGQPVNLNLLMTQYGRPPPPVYAPPEPHAIYYYTTAQLNLDSPQPANQQQQAMQLTTGTCCCHQQQHQLALLQPQPVAPPTIGSKANIDDGCAQQSSDAERDSRDAASGKTSPAQATTTRDGDLSNSHRNGQNLSQDLTSSPPPEQQQPLSPAGCLGKTAPPSAPHSPPSTTATISQSSSSVSGSHHHQQQPAASSRAAYMGHSQQQPRDQQEAIRPYYRQPSGPTYYHHLLPDFEPGSHNQHPLQQQHLHHHNQQQQQDQQYYNNTSLQQQQYSNPAQQQQYLVASRQYMQPHLYGHQQQPHYLQNHQLHLATTYPNPQQQQQQHRHLILLPPQAALNYPEINYQQLAGYQHLYGHHLATTYAPHHHHHQHHHAITSLHPTAPYHHQHQAYACHLATMRFQPPHLVPTNYHQPPISWPPTAPPISYYAQQHQQSALAPKQLMPNPTVDVGRTSSPRHKPDVDFLLLFKQAQTWASMLPIDYEPTKTRQAYGMDKVWRDEFEQLFSQLSSNVGWTLVEVETNPSLRNSPSIVGYRGRYIIQPELDDQSQVVEVKKEEGEGSLCNEIIDSVSDESSDSANESTSSKDNLSLKAADTAGDALDVANGEGEEREQEQETESDCDSGTQVNSTRGCSSSSPNQLLEVAGVPSVMKSPCLILGEIETQEQQFVSSSTSSPPPAPVTTVRSFSTRFRMFIDSAKVRFCCDHCGHGWTSMKGRVVFWYELFELLPKLTSSVVVVEEVDDEESHLIGYCAYKLFGQQCDVCNIEGRFERPMWYPEEVTKVLNNLYNKIGQVYFGFKMPTIDKQRRAGKPKTSHNSSLCQACYDGVCTDRK